MIIATNELNVVTGGNIKPKITDFHIAATAHAFKVLSDSLYSDKIGAVIRELSTNAYDAHVYMGKRDVPFVVTLPNSLNPTFSVRDYGPGMNCQEIEKLYTTYFKSGNHKLESNDYVGCLGLGSKSPFAYTSAFTITSFQNGKQHAYSAYLSEDGIPKCQFLGTTDTEEQDGLLVSLPVRQYDFMSFANTSKRIYAYFKTTPIINGNPSCVIIRPTYTNKNTSLYGIRSGGSGYANIVMGNVSYSIGTIPSSIPNSVKQLLMSPIDLFFNVGDINITPSRETVAYSVSTVKVLTERCDQIATSLEKDISKEIEECDSLWKARTKFVELYTASSNNIGRLINYQNIAWRGQKIMDAIDSGKILIYVDRKAHDDTVLSITECYYRDYGRRKYVVKPTNNITSAAYRQSIFVEDDGAKQCISRCKYYVSRNSKTTLYLLRFATSAEKQYFINLLGITDKDFVKLSKLPKPTIYRTTTTKYATTAKVFEFKSGIYEGSADYSAWSEVTMDIKQTTDQVYYVPMLRYKSIQNNGKELENYMLARIVVGWRAITKYNGNIIGIRKDLLSKLRLPPNWINLYDHITNMYTADVLRLLSLKEMLAKIDRNTSFCKIAPIVKDINLPDNDPLKVLCDLFNEYLDGCKKQAIDTLHDTYRYMSGITIPTVNFDHNTCCKMISAKYVLLDYVLDNYDFTYLKRVPDTLKNALKSYIEKTA